MRRFVLSLFVILFSVVSLSVSSGSGFFVFAAPDLSQVYEANHTGPLGQMWSGMGGMMGNSSGFDYQAPVQSSASLWVGVVFVASVVLAVVGVGGLAYFFVSREKRNNAYGVSSGLGAVPNASFAEPAKTMEENKALAFSPLETLIKTLTVDERRVVDVLSSHGGRHLQKYIRNEAGLSRLQTHRVVSRLAERGIVSLEKVGNTNNVLLSDWLKP
jgi:hypothetical protein